MIRSFRLIFLLALIAPGVFSALAAPIPPVGPYDVTGTIQEVRWVPERTVKGIPQMSGSAGKDRVESPHFRIKLVDYAGAAL